MATLYFIILLSLVVIVTLVVVVFLIPAGAGKEATKTTCPAPEASPRRS